MFLYNASALIVFVLVSHPTAFLQNGSRNARPSWKQSPPPPEPDMMQVLRLMLEEREAARAERQANLSTLQHLAQLATNNNNRGGNGDDEPQTKLRDF
jgi:hypothetical protein